MSQEHDSELNQALADLGMGQEDWFARRMSDEELLDRSLAALEENYWTLVQMHQRHGTALEDICCRVATGDAINVLAEGERREEQKRA